MIPSLRYALHPLYPERLGYRRLLGWVHPGLASLLAATDPYTLITARRRVTLYRAARRVLARNVPGDFVEIGVYRGGSAALLGRVLASAADRKLHLFDRWGDLPDPTLEDGFRFEQYRKDRIADKLRQMRSDPPRADTERALHDVIGFPRERTCYYPGWYGETLAPQSTLYPGAPIAFASLDCDYYESMKPALAFVGRYLSPGGAIVVDDFRSWPGVRRALDEFLARSESPFRLEALRIDQAILYRGAG
jgi:hypothetical protein